MLLYIFLICALMPPFIFHFRGSCVRGYAMCAICMRARHRAAPPRNATQACMREHRIFFLFLSTCLRGSKTHPFFSVCAKNKRFKIKVGRNCIRSINAGAAAEKRVHAKKICGKMCCGVMYKACCCSLLILCICAIL